MNGDFNIVIFKGFSRNAKSLHLDKNVASKFNMAPSGLQERSVFIHCRRMYHVS